MPPPHLVHLLALSTEPPHEKRADRFLLSRCFRPVISGWWTTSVDIAAEEAGPDGTGVTKPEGFAEGFAEPRLWVSEPGHSGVMYRRPLQAVARNLLRVTASRAARAEVNTPRLTLAPEANARLMPVSQVARLSGEQSAHCARTATGRCGQNPGFECHFGQETSRSVCCTLGVREGSGLLA